MGRRWGADSPRPGRDKAACAKFQGVPHESRTACARCLARHDACVASRRAAWHSSREHVRCRPPTRGSGWNHRRHSRHGRFLAVMPAIVARKLGPYLVVAAGPCSSSATSLGAGRVTSREHGWGHFWLALKTQGRMLTVAEAARRLRVSRATVYKLVAEGRLAHVRIGTQIRFLPGSIPPARR